MLDDILQNWDQEANSNLISQIKGKMGRSKSFRKRVIYSIYYLKIQQERLEKIVFRLNRRHEECFDKCVHAKNKNDNDRVSIYAEECDQVKKIVKVGNSAGVVLPREWYGGEARVELIKRPMNIQEDVLKILRPHLPNILGIYIVGSYARGEQTSESDVDILVIVYF